jgi:hypothetical protein
MTQRFSWIPTYRQSGIYPDVLFEVTDGDGEDDNEGGIDANTGLILHCNTDTSFHDSSPSGHTVLGYGGAAIDTSEKKFGTGSLRTGYGSYLNVPAHDDWAFGTDDFTIDFWVNFDTLPSTNTFSPAVSVYERNDRDWWTARLWNLWGQYYWYFQYWDGTSYPLWCGSAARPLSTDTWYHVAFVRDGGTMYVFENGSQVGVASVSADASVPLLNLPLSIGEMGYYHNGWFDEVRVSKGIARWTKDFTPADSEYVEEND